MSSRFLLLGIAVVQISPDDGKRFYTCVLFELLVIVRIWLGLF